MFYIVVSNKGSIQLWCCIRFLSTENLNSCTIALPCFISLFAQSARNSFVSCCKMSCLAHISFIHSCSMLRIFYCGLRGCDTTSTGLSFFFFGQLCWTKLSFIVMRVWSQTPVQSCVKKWFQKSAQFTHIMNSSNCCQVFCIHGLVPSLLKLFIKLSNDLKNYLNEPTITTTSIILTFNRVFFFQNPLIHSISPKQHPQPYSPLKPSLLFIFSD